MDNQPLYLPDLDDAISGQDLLEWKYSDQMQDYLLTLLHTSTFESRAWVDIEKQIEGELTKEEYDHLFFMLQQNQLDRITSGLMYGAGDIQKHLKKFM